ncbi:cell division protein FtsL [Chelonobacter oris]|uniref:Cell division protein FtsL n=1 Tax=Chelonobacter oris TaxID=505317 RepID=A0A0A3AKL8_9PAST|nr:cell division protein FtsL [Chelonobacter oris]KGQ69943.1 cell division protein FtsL [Chelonobacter oris]MDH3000623.1 cell division protein FtsL [Chelonobacter oris]
MNGERYPLRKLILDDLFVSNKIALLLLAGMIVSAVATIWIIHQTRRLNSENGELILAKQALENEYINLKLEERALDDNVRITSIANRLKMGYITPNQQVIIIENNH